MQASSSRSEVRNASARPAAERVTFLCLCKEKSPKESTPRQSAFRASCAPGSLRFSALQGRSDSASMHCFAIAAIHRRDPAGFSRKACDARRLAGAPFGGVPAAEAKARESRYFAFSLCAQERAAVGAPVVRRGRGGKAVGWRARCAPVRCMYMDVHSANPVVRSRTRRAGCPESAAPGWPSLWLLSLGHTRESDPLACKASGSSARWL